MKKKTRSALHMEDVTKRILDALEEKENELKVELKDGVV